MAGLKYISPTGREIDLAKQGDWCRSIAYGGFVGLVGTKTPTTATMAGVPGETPTSWATPPMTGELRLHLVKSEGMPTVDELESEVRREVHTDEPGWLVLDREKAVSPVSCKVHLNGYIEAPLEFLDEGATDAEMRVPLISYPGLWEFDPMEGTGNVTVMNHGDAFLWPTIIWEQAILIRLPSGMTALLPAPPAGKVATMSLNPHTSHEVTVDGTVDEPMSAVTKYLELGEGVPRGQSRDYMVPTGGVLSWTLTTTDPWR